MCVGSLQYGIITCSHFLSQQEAVHTAVCFLSSIKQQTDKGSDLFVITVEQIEGEVTDIFLESWWRPKQRGFLSFIWPDPAEVWQERGAWYAANGHRSGLSFVHGAHTSHTYWANWRPTKAELNGEWILGLTSDLCVACLIGVLV